MSTANNVIKDFINSREWWKHETSELIEAKIEDLMKIGFTDRAAIEFVAGIVYAMDGEYGN